jgi:hypothetical protein
MPVSDYQVNMGGKCRENSEKYTSKVSIIIYPLTKETALVPEADGKTVSWMRGAGEWLLKCKCIPALNQLLTTLCDVYGSEGVAPPFLTSGLNGVSSQLQVPAALPPDEVLLVLYAEGGGRAPELEKIKISRPSRKC